MSDWRPGADIDWRALRERLARAGERLRGGGAVAADRATLEARARALALAPQAPRAPDAMPVVVFRLGGERYALESAFVREVLRVPRLTALPGAPAFAAGLANLRGTVVDVFDLRAFLGAAARPADPGARLLVLGADRPELALYADAVEGIAELARAELAPPPESAARLRSEYVRGLSADGVALLDAARLLRDPRLVIDDAPPGPTTEVP